MANQVQIEKYAQILLTCGVALRKGDGLHISVPMEGRQLVYALQKTAYAMGAKDVVVQWTDEEFEENNLFCADINCVRDAYRHQHAYRMKLAESGYLFLRLYAPAFLSDAQELSTEAMEWQKEKAGLDAQLRNKAPFGAMCIACCPTFRWAQKVFPKMSGKDALEKLWEQLLYICRADLENPVEAWSEHGRVIVEQGAKMTALELDSIHLVGPGTDLELGLIPNHTWGGGRFPNTRGDFVVPNIPTEELGSSPDRRRVNGRVQATKPLNYQGGLIENFWIEFKDGKAIAWNAEKGNDILTRIISHDEGSAYLGECAIVEHDSPISNTGNVFMCTLLDENAACHLALGNGFPFAVKGGPRMTVEELDNIGINRSGIHVDFMVGSGQIDIYGTTHQGEKILLVKQGAWVI